MIQVLRPPPVGQDVLEAVLTLADQFVEIGRLWDRGRRRRRARSGPVPRALVPPRAFRPPPPPSLFQGIEFTLALPACICGVI